MKWFGHVTRKPGTLANTILYGAVDRQRRSRRPRTSWTTNMKDWMGLKLTYCTRIAKAWEEWRKGIATSKMPQ